MHKPPVLQRRPASLCKTVGKAACEANVTLDSGSYVSINRSILLAAFALLALPVCAWAQDVAPDAAAPIKTSPEIDQRIYKGLVGNVLDSLPMDAVNRVHLQRTNAVISNAFTGRSLAVLAGGGPLLMLGGLVWGIWSASQINPAVEVVDARITVVNSSVEDVASVAAASVADDAPTAPNPQVVVAYPIEVPALSSALAETETQDVQGRIAQRWNELELGRIQLTKLEEPYIRFR